MNKSQKSAIRGMLESEFKVKPSQAKRTKPGTFVVLTKLPTGFLRGLPTDAQKAIRHKVGKRVLLERYDEDGRAVLTFGSLEDSHSIFVDPKFIKV